MRIIDEFSTHGMRRAWKYWVVCVS